MSIEEFYYFRVYQNKSFENIVTLGFPVYLVDVDIKFEVSSCIEEKNPRNL